MTVDIASGWHFDVDEGPDWIFLRLHRSSDESAAEPPVAARGWAIVEDLRKSRVIFELADRLLLSSFLVGQLILLHKRAELAGGLFRICAFSPQAYGTLKSIRVADRFPNYLSREDAVMGRLPAM